MNRHKLNDRTQLRGLKLKLKVAKLRIHMEASKNFNDRFSMLLHVEEFEIRTGDDDLRLIYEPNAVDLKNDFTL